MAKMKNCNFFLLFYSKEEYKVFMVLKKSWVLFFLFSFFVEVSSASRLDEVSPEDGEAILEGGPVTSLDGVSPWEGEFILDERGSPTNKKPLDATLQRNASFLIEALQNEDMESISSLSEKELNQVFLYARGSKGGNLLHYMARNKSLNPNFLQQFFEGEYKEHRKKSEYAWPPNEEYTVREEIFKGLAKILQQKTFGKALKLKNNEGFTPKELARQNKNKLFLKILRKIEGNYNHSIDATQALLGSIALVGIPAGLVMLTTTGNSELGLGLLTGGSVALCHATFLQKKKLP